MAAWRLFLGGELCGIPCGWMCKGACQAEMRGGRSQSRCALSPDSTFSVERWERWVPVPWWAVVNNLTHREAVSREVEQWREVAGLCRRLCPCGVSRMPCEWWGLSGQHCHVPCRPRRGSEASGLASSQVLQPCLVRVNADLEWAEAQQVWG